MPELKAQRVFLLRAPEALPDLRLFRRNVALMKVDQRTVRFGIKGQCDLYGLLRGGQHIEIELKSLTAQLTDAQKAWRDFCQTWQVPWVCLREYHDETTDKTVMRWIYEIGIVCGGR